MNGYMGKLLRVDMTNQNVTDEPLDEEILRNYLGGSGLAAKILIEETDADTDPLSGDNILIFMTGPFAGTNVPCSGRHTVIAKSPLTGIWGEASVGGSWGVMLKKAGYDGVVVKGIASEPLYLWINNGNAELRKAAHLWGKDSFEVDGIVKNETDSKAEITSIGQGGENLANIACVMNDGKEGRAAGRCGLGAVMGSKKLKAIAVFGNQSVAISKPEELKASILKAVPAIKENAAGLGKFGTSGGYLALEDQGNLPIKNWKLGEWREGAEKITGQRMTDTILTGRFHCKACPIGCGRRVKVDGSKYGKVDGGGPEYETLAMMGSNLLIDDLEAISVANDLCNRYGLDTISVGGVIAFAMEAFEKGFITKENTGGLEIRWGDPEVMIQLIHQIAKREGIGDLLAKGVKQASEEIGGLAPEIALHVKGLELPAHDPRAHNSAALSYAVSNRGACHLASQSQAVERGMKRPDLGFPEIHDRYGIERTGELVSKMGDLMCIFDALSFCRMVQFGGVDSHKMLEWLNLVTGWNMDYDAFIKTGTRIYDLKRLYNVKLGVSRKDDTLPVRMLTLRRKTGGTPDNLPPLGRLLADFYDYRGWSEEGIPRKETLNTLGLDFAAEYGA